MCKKRHFLSLLLLLIGLSGFAQKTILNIPLKAYVDLQTANYFGGKLAIQDSINKQFQRVNQYYNAENRFNNIYNFYVSSFHFYTDNANNDSTNYYTQTLITNYLKIVYDNFVAADAKGYNSYLETILFLHDGVNGKNGHMFGRMATRGLTHELGHSRSAIDLYAGNVEGIRNQVVTGLGFLSPYNSIMNNLYAESGWDTHSIYLMNTTASTYGVGPFSGAQHNTIVKNAFPKNIAIRVKNASGGAVANATVKLYGIPWYIARGDNASGIRKLTTSDLVLTSTTNTSGLLTFSGSSANPFNPSYAGEDATQYFNFLVEVTANGQTKYDWLPIYAVQNSFISGATTHYLDVVVKTSTTAAPNQLPYADIIQTSDGQYRTYPSDVWVVVNSDDLDGSVTNINIYDGNTLLGNANYESNADRYSYQLLSPAIGTHSIKAIATDNRGATAQTLPMLIQIVPAAPAVNVSSPSNNSTFSSGTTITLSAGVTAGTGNVTKVEFYNGVTKLGEDASAPYSISWTISGVTGPTQLSARVYDNQGMSAAANAVDINVTQSGTCTAPQWNAGNTSYVTGTIVKNTVDGVVKKYQCTVGGWCQSTSGFYYEPGKGLAWTQCWSDLGTCTSRMAADMSEEAASAVSLDVHPNPSSNSSVISGYSPDHAVVTILVTNSIGAEVLNKEVLAGSGGFNYQLDLTVLTPGVYTVKATFGNTVLTRKLVRN